MHMSTIRFHISWDGKPCMVLITTNQPQLEMTQPSIAIKDFDDDELLFPMLDYK